MKLVSDTELAYRSILDRLLGMVYCISPAEIRQIPVSVVNID